MKVLFSAIANPPTSLQLHGLLGGGAQYLEIMRFTCIPGTGEAEVLVCVEPGLHGKALSQKQD